jgi:hypothetical protein
MAETVKGLAAYLRRLAAVPDKVKAAAKAELHAGADDLVQVIRRAAPVDESEARPGALRDSVHWYAHPQRELSVRIIADARDAKGRMIGQHVEFGHSNAAGGHVPAKPFFFPSYRARKKALKRKISAAVRKVIKES